ncbi:hypothetical protein EJB05_45377, partial [Eragrostis curvula]
MSGSKTKPPISVRELLPLDSPRLPLVYITIELLTSHSQIEKRKGYHYCIHTLNWKNNRSSTSHHRQALFGTEVDPVGTYAFGPLNVLDRTALNMSFGEWEKDYKQASSKVKFHPVIPTDSTHEHQMYISRELVPPRNGVSTSVDTTHNGDACDRANRGHRDRFFAPRRASNSGQVLHLRRPRATVRSTLGAICLEALRPGELCSEVPACGHVFHFLGNCVATWARSKGSCPLCTAEIVPGSDVAVADDMVLCRWCVAADKTVFRMGEE